MINPCYNNSGITIYNNDCLDIMKEMPDNSVDTVITDPPYPLYKQPASQVLPLPI